MSSFYVVLPSNASLKLHPGNTLTEYTVQLPVPIHLEGKYEVGLQSFEYTRSWNNIKEGENRIKFSINGINMEMDITQGFYSSERDIVEMINTFIEREIVVREKHDTTIKKLLKITDPKKYIYMDFDPMSRRVTLFTAATTSLWMSRGLADILGFARNQFGEISSTALPLEECIAALKTLPHAEVRGTFQVDYHRGLHMLYVYCNIVTGQVVGDVWAPLIKTVPVGGEHGANVMTEYISPQYIPVLTNQFPSITISIRDDAGEKVSFEHGRVTATLHFRRQSEL